MGAMGEFTKGLLKENPVLVLLLGLCPTLAVTTGLSNAIGMGLAATFVLVCSNLLISIFKSLIPKEIRIPIFIIVIATFVTIVKLVMAAYFPALKASLGIFLALIVVNCIILGRAEAFASKKNPLLSVIDGLGMGLGFTLALCLIAFFRELLGSGTLFGIPLVQGLDAYTQKIFILAPGGFLTLGLILFVFGWLKTRHDKKQMIRKNLEMGREERGKELLGGAEYIAAYESKNSSHKS